MQDIVDSRLWGPATAAARRLPCLVHDMKWGSAEQLIYSADLLLKTNVMDVRDGAGWVEL